MDTKPQRLTATVTGEVQAVGFRYWARRSAEDLGLTGSAINNPDGSVSLVAEGPTSGITELLRRIEAGETPGRVDSVDAAIRESSESSTGFECL